MKELRVDRPSRAQSGVLPPPASGFPDAGGAGQLGISIYGDSGPDGGRSLDQREVACDADYYD